MNGLNVFICCQLIDTLNNYSVSLLRSYTNYSRKEEQDGLIVGIAVSVGVVILLFLFVVLYMPRKTSEKDDDEGKRAMSILLRVNSACGSRFFLVLISVFERKYFRCVVSKFKPMSHSLLNAELRAATEDFNPSNKLGEGGYGPIYKVKSILHQYLLL